MYSHVDLLLMTISFLFLRDIINMTCHSRESMGEKPWTMKYFIYNKDIVVHLIQFIDNIIS